MSLKKVVLLLPMLMVCMIFTSSLQAQVRATTKAKKIKSTKPLPLNAKVLNLSPSAAKTLAKWKKAMNFQLLKNGHFVPLRHKIPASVKANIRKNNNQNSNIPSTGTNNFAAGDVNCAKIECPPGFGDNVTCWECH